METKLTKDYARLRDAESKLLPFREQFNYPKCKAYHVSHTLGLMPKTVQEGINQYITDWADNGAEGWTLLQEPWLTFSESIGAKVAELVGAHPSEVIATGTSTQNLISLLATFYKPMEERMKILTIDQISVSDIYAIQSYMQLLGIDPFENLVIHNTQNSIIHEKDIISQMDDDVMLIILPSVTKINAQKLNLASITNEAHKKQILIGFDLSDSVGAIQHSLTEWEIDFAYWNSDKYMFGGPAGISFMFIHQNHFGRMPGLQGWFGNRNDTKFDFALNFVPAKGAKAWQISASNMVSLYTLDKSIDVILEAGIDSIREESVQLTNYLIWLTHSVLSMAPMNFELLTPEKNDQRGAHVTWRHKQASKIQQIMKGRGYQIEFRKPDLIRVSPSPFYNSFEEMLDLVLNLKEIFERREIDKN